MKFILDNQFVNNPPIELRPRHSRRGVAASGSYHPQPLFLHQWAASQQTQASLVLHSACTIGPILGGELNCQCFSFSISLTQCNH